MLIYYFYSQILCLYIAHVDLSLLFCFVFLCVFCCFFVVVFLLLFFCVLFCVCVFFSCYCWLSVGFFGGGGGGGVVGLFVSVSFFCFCFNYYYFIIIIIMMAKLRQTSANFNLICSMTNCSFENLNQR